MKRSLSAVVLAALCLFAACDYVDDPYPQGNVNVSDTASCPSPSFPALSNHVKKIVIEDFTGHTCGNCPKAAKELHEIDSIYPGRIIGVAIHVGGYAVPSPGYNGSSQSAFLNDYRTDAGELYDATFGATGFGLPQGMFNRKDYDAVNQTHLKFYPNWKTEIAGMVAAPSVLDLQLDVDFDMTTRKLCVAVKDSFLTAMSGNYNLTVLLTQDSIVSWQDYIGVNKSDYVHRHVLRDAITPTGAWGEPLATGPVSAGSKAVKRFAYTIPADYKGVTCDVNQCHVVAYVYNTITYEIIQAEEVEVIP